MPPITVPPVPVLKLRAPRGDAWMRWVKIWHIVFYLSLALPALMVLFSGTMRYSAGVALRLSLFLGLWYGLVMMWLLPKTRGTRQTILSLIFLAVALPVWFALSRANWAYYLTVSSFFGMMWGTLPFAWAVSGNILLVGLIIWSQAVNSGRSVTFSVELLIIAGMTIGWSVLLALWIRSVIRESAERKRLIEQLEAAQKSLAAAERQAGILQERQRLAQEIHDTLAQGFTSIIMQLEAADLALSQEQREVRTRLFQASETARQSLGEARRLVQALRPEPLDSASLPEAMRRVSERWTQETGTALAFSVTGGSYALHPEVEVTLLRLLQEGLSNISKHARAHQATVTLTYMEDQVALDIHDDGVGFNPESISQPSGGSRGGFGMQMMRERVAQIGGQMAVESCPGQGTALAFQIPVEESQ